MKARGDKTLYRTEFESPFVFYANGFCSCRSFEPTPLNTLRHSPSLYGPGALRREFVEDAPPRIQPPAGAAEAERDVWADT